MAATIARYNDPLDFVSIKRLVVQNPSTQGSGAFVLFEGRTAPVGARSEHIFNEWEFEAVYGRNEHGDAADLLDLLRAAHQAADGRLTLTTVGGQDARINLEQPIEVHSWSQSREPGGVIRIQFQATEVDG